MLSWLGKNNIFHDQFFLTASLFQPDIKNIFFGAFDDFSSDIAVHAKPVCQERTLYRWDKSLYARIVSANDIHAVERNLIHERSKSIVDGFLAAIVVDMIIIDIGHYIDYGKKAKE